VGAIPQHGLGGLTGATLAVADPTATAARWAHVLGLPADGPAVPLADGAIDFVSAGGGPDRLVAVEARGGSPRAADIGGVRFAIL
jgi:hypothetical protein